MATLRDLEISPRRVLPARLLTVSYSRSGGPGGQNVNKVATKVDLRLDLAGAAEFLGEAAVETLRQELTARLDGDGNLWVVSSEHREQIRNLEAAQVRMETLIRGALTPRKTRRPTRPSRAARERRLTAKRVRSRVKRDRADPSDD